VQLIELSLPVKFGGLVGGSRRRVGSIHRPLDLVITIICCAPDLPVNPPARVQEPAAPQLADPRDAKRAPADIRRLTARLN
jgi:hypothetical protein